MRKDKELERIVEKFGDAMRRANKKFITEWNGRMTLRQDELWQQYVEWCYRRING